MDGQPQTFFIGQGVPFSVGARVSTEIVEDRLVLTVTPYVEVQEPKAAPLRERIKHQRFEPKKP